MSIRVQLPFWAGIVFLAFLACSKQDQNNQKNDSDQFVKSGQYLGEYFPTESWRECNPMEVGMDPELLEDLDVEIETLIANGYQMHTVLVIRKGYIVAEKNYSVYFDQETQHKIHSCTKSFTSALVGIAISKGYIEGVDEKMVDFFPEYEILNLTESKKEITLEHMLTMSAGLDWDELDYLYTDPMNTFYQWRRVDNRILFILDRPMEAAPGQLQNYNSGLSDLLSVIIQKSTGMRTDSFAMENLFNYLGISDFYWPIDPAGHAMGYGGMRLAPRSMAKLGYLHVMNGKWEDKQIIPEAWIEKSGKRLIPYQHIPGFFYGYQFWVSSYGMYAAVGYQGQWIMIIPEYGMVVVWTNLFDEGDGDQWNTPERLLNEYILPAVID